MCLLCDLRCCDVEHSNATQTWLDSHVCLGSAKWCQCSQLPVEAIQLSAADVRIFHCTSVAQVALGKVQVWKLVANLWITFIVLVQTCCTKGQSWPSAVMNMKHPFWRVTLSHCQTPSKSSKMRSQDYGAEDENKVFAGHLKTEEIIPNCSLSRQFSGRILSRTNI